MPWHQAFEIENPCVIAGDTEKIWIDANIDFCSRAAEFMFNISKPCLDPLSLVREMGCYSFFLSDCTATRM